MMLPSEASRLPPSLPFPVVVTLLDSLDKVSASEELVQSYTSADGHSVLTCIYPDGDYVNDNNDHGHDRDHRDMNDRRTNVAHYMKQRVMKSPKYLYMLCKKIISSYRNTDGTGDHGGDSNSDWNISIHFGDERENLTLKIRRDDDSGNGDSDGDNEEKQKSTQESMSITLGLFLVEKSNETDREVSMLYSKDNIYQSMKGRCCPSGGATKIHEIRICPISTQPLKKESVNININDEQNIGMRNSTTSIITFWEGNDGGTLKRYQIGNNSSSNRHGQSRIGTETTVDEAPAPAPAPAPASLATETTI